MNITRHEAEAMLIGTLLRYSNNELLAEALDCGLQSAHFMDERLRDVWIQITLLESQKRPWDLATISAGCPVLGPVFLIELVESAPVAQNVGYFAKEVVAASWRRGIRLEIGSLFKVLENHAPFTPMDELRAQTSSQTLLCDRWAPGHGQDDASGQLRNYGRHGGAPGRLLHH